ncbi:MAG: acyltransferase [Candidatus Micrarchaeia archaeon]|jgi:acetyltransferase-like isoleucine patch superfamily enzyme
MGLLSKIYHRVAGIILVPVAMFAPFNSMRVLANRLRGVGISKTAQVGFLSFIDQPIGVSEPRVVIEDGAIIGFHNIIFSHDTSTAMRGVPDEQAWGKVRICKNAVLGPNVMVLMNATVGEGAIIEPGSVVTKDVPPHTIAAGMPARPVKRIVFKDGKPTEAEL